jgi:hypothetical protein
MASPQKLLGERLDVPVYAPLVRPGIWRDETYAHGRLRVGHPSEPAGSETGHAEGQISLLSAQAKPVKTSR